MSNSRRILNLFGYALIIILVINLLITLDYTNLMASIRQVNPNVIFLLISLQLLTQLLITWQWHIICKIVINKSNFWKVLNIFTRGSVVEAITPGAKIGGEATRLYYIKKDFDCDTEKAVSVILIQKCISMSVLLTICVLAFVYLSIKMMNDLLSSLLVIIVCVTLIAMMIVLLFFPEKIKHKYAQSYAQTTKMLTKSEWLILFFISVVVWLLFPIKMAILVYSFDIKLPPAIIFAVTMTSYMAGMLPITPGGIGTFEGTMITWLTMLSVASEVSVTITIIFRFITFWFVNLASAMCVVLYKLISARGKFDAGENS
ncbi:MAG: hypothetical protein ATN35_12065 [Epulopiscium sp. Nele67-Bin004]|nr:MAG: hypothetical protein ATN35_12065 [Epulopiscium sp. Nele67-Bin004]